MEALQAAGLDVADGFTDDNLELLADQVARSIHAQTTVDPWASTPDTVLPFGLAIEVAHFMRCSANFMNEYTEATDSDTVAACAAMFAVAAIGWDTFVTSAGPTPDALVPAPSQALLHSMYLLGDLLDALSSEFARQWMGDEVAIIEETARSCRSYLYDFGADPRGVPAH